MSKEKQIDEMARSLNEATFGVNVHTLADHLHPETIHKVAEYLYNAGYRKQGEVAREIFAEIENCMSCFEDDDDGYLLKKCEFKFFMRELKKEYTEESVNDR